MLNPDDISDARAPGASMLAIRRCRHGTMMYLRQDVYIGRSFTEYGEYSEGEVDLFRQCLRPGDVALDIGANLGAHTLPMAQLVGPSGAVFAFEPQRILFQILCANVALNELPNVHALPVALGRAVGRTKVPALDYRGASNFGGVSLGGAHGEDVPVLTLDQLEVSKIKLIKIDVEGMELDVLAGAKQTLARCRPILYVENDRADKAEALVRGCRKTATGCGGTRRRCTIRPIFSVIRTTCSATWPRSTCCACRARARRRSRTYARSRRRRRRQRCCADCRR
jgi:FkbM family methyltransferase